MKLTIYNTTVPVTSQEMANRLLNVCKEYGLPIWKESIAFDFYLTDDNYFGYSTYEKTFAVWGSKEDEGVLTESEWMELLKNTEL